MLLKILGDIQKGRPDMFKKVSSKYSKLNVYFKKCIKALYGEVNDIDEQCFKPDEMITSGNSKNDLTDMDTLDLKTGVYIFINKDYVPVYIGIGGKNFTPDSKIELLQQQGKSSTREIKNKAKKKLRNIQDLQRRIGQELRAYKWKSGDSGATLSKNIQEIGCHSSISSEDKQKYKETCKNYYKPSIENLKKNIKEIEEDIKNKEKKKRKNQEEIKKLKETIKKLKAEKKKFRRRIITPIDSIEIIKELTIKTITVGDITKKEAVYKARVLEQLLIAIYRPIYNKIS